MPSQTFLPYMRKLSRNVNNVHVLRYNALHICKLEEFLFFPFLRCIFCHITIYGRREQSWRKCLHSPCLFYNFLANKRMFTYTLFVKNQQWFHVPFATQSVLWFAFPRVSPTVMQVSDHSNQGSVLVVMGMLLYRREK